MGAKHPDQIAMPPAPELALTLAEMYARGWTLQASCRRCSLRIRVGLPGLIKLHGPDAIWWGKATPCPGWACAGGTLRYAAQALKGGTWRSVTDTRPAPVLLANLKTRLDHVDRGPR